MKKTLIALMILAVSASVSLAERGDGDGNWKRGGRDGGMRKEMKAEMKAQMKVLRQMGEDIRAETDEAKKAEMTAALRVKVSELVDAKATKQKERLAKAEEKLAKLKDRTEDFNSKRDGMIDEKVERLVSGKRARRGDTDAFRDHPHAKGGRGGPDGRGPEDGSGPRGPRGPGGGPLDGSGPGCDDDAPPPPPPADADAPPPAE
jgi:hypothetical protein